MYAKHREKRVLYAREYRKKNPGLQFRQYGITQDTFNELFDRQGGLCAICREPEKSRSRLSVDHRHNDGLVRGLLCNKCNRALGYFGDSVQNIENAVKYLQNHL